MSEEKAKQNAEEKVEPTESEETKSEAKATEKAEEKAGQKTEKLEFQSEVKQLLEILVYSLYKNKEVFLRELISNAVDAINKVKFQILTDENVAEKDLDLKIDISFDKTRNRLVVEDTGIGMTRQEIIDNIGTIARSGTMNFLKRAVKADEQTKMDDMIGKFGVGFYSSFMVASEIHIITKSFRKTSKAYLWKSRGSSNYTIEETVKKQRGTRIELILKKDEKEFMEKYRVKHIITKHSQFVPFPLYIEGEKIDSKEAIWTQPKSSLKEKDYQEFFKFFDTTPDNPETYLHLSSDAPVQFNTILFLPKTSTEMPGFFKSEPGVDLYSRKVLIQKGCRDILPEYLRFVKGIIDSEDIPLNISRETIQNDILIDKIKKHIMKKLFEHLEKIKKKKKEKYLDIWKSHGKHFKEGIAADFENREKLAQLLLFHSSKKSQDEFGDLAEYVKDMKKDQDYIYYITGFDIGLLSKNPALEAFKKKDIEVLYLTEPLDEIAVDHLKEFEGKHFKTAEAADIQFDEEDEDKKKKEEGKEKEKDEQYQKELNNFVGYLKTVYGDKLEDVKVSRRLVDSPCLLVHSGQGPSIQMEKIMKMTSKDYNFSKRIFELNGDHDLIKEMVAIHKKKPDSPGLIALAWQLLDNMMLREGIIDNIDEVVPRIQDIMLNAAKTLKK